MGPILFIYFLQSHLISRYLDWDLAFELLYVFMSYVNSLQLYLG